MLCILALPSGEAQNYATREQRLDDPKVFGHNSVSINLAEMLNYGLEVSYERKIVDKHWLMLAPAFYGWSDYTLGPQTEIRYLRGGGLKLQHKYYVWNETRHKTALFLTYGAQYQYFDVFSKNMIESIIHRFSLNCQLGFRMILGKVFFFEATVGVGTRFVDRSDSWHGPDAKLSDYNGFFNGFAKSGPQINFGLSLGAVL